MDRSGPPSRRAPRAAHLEMALAHLAAYGPADGGRRVSISGIARDLGISRTSVYRCWPTAEALAEDVLIHTATRRSGWQLRVLDQDPRRPLADAVRDALVVGETEPGVLARARAGALETGSSARVEIARWERRWLQSFADWLGDPARATGVEPGDTPWLDVALALTARIEGAVLGHAHLAGVPAPPIDAPMSDRVGRSVSDAFAVLVERSRGEAPPLDAEAEAHPSPRSMGDAQGLLLARIEAHEVDAERRGEVVPGRLVNLERLARALGLSARALYDAWPTPSDLNADLARAVISRARAATEQLALAVLSDSSDGPPERLSQLSTEAVHEAITGGDPAIARAHLAAMAAFADPTVAAVVAEESLAWLAEQTVVNTAVLHSVGFELRPETTMHTFGASITTSVLGAIRLVHLHPQLADRRVRYGGMDRPTLAVGVEAIARAATQARS